MARWRVAASPCRVLEAAIVGGETVETLDGCACTACGEGAIETMVEGTPVAGGEASGQLPQVSDTVGLVSERLQGSIESRDSGFTVQFSGCFVRVAQREVFRAQVVSQPDFQGTSL